MAIEYITLPTYTLEITADEQAVTGVRRVDEAGPAHPNALTRRAADAISAYLAGGALAGLPLRPAGTAFEQAVWQALRQIPYGQTRCYADIAAAIGRPSSTRAVGRAVGKNPILLFIPCHRVIGRNGSLTGFSAGLDLKRFLLKLERE